MMFPALAPTPSPRASHTSTSVPLDLNITLWGVRFHYNSPFVLTFVLGCVAVFALDCVSGSWLSTHLFCINGYFSLARPQTWPMLVLHTMGHVSLRHLTNNMSLVLLLGVWRLH